MINIKQYLNLKGFLILFAVILFILLNSIQETYIPLENMEPTTLETIQTGSATTGPTTTETETIITNTFTGTLPEYTPSPSKFPATVIISILLSVVIIGLIIYLLLKRRQYVTYTPSGSKPSLSSKTIDEKRALFRTQVVTLKDVLLEYLEKQQYSEGVIFGYWTMDENMKKLLGLKRKSSLTPKEFAESLKLPQIIQNLKNIVNLFYRARYKLERLKKRDLVEFINNLDLILEKSKTSQQLEVKKIIVKEEH